MDNKEKLELLEEALDLDEGALSPEMELSGVAAYDSMAKLTLIVVMKDEFGKQLTSDTIKTFVTVQDILDYMG